MKKTLLCGIVVSTLCVCAHAQDYRASVSGAYSTESIQPATSTGRLVGYGWEADIAAKLFSAFGLVVDTSGHYGNLNGAGVNVHTVMLGPRYTINLNKIRIKFFAQSLYGVSVIHVNGAALISALDGRSSTSFNFAPVGVGVDTKITDRVSFRPLEFNLLYSDWGNRQTQVNFEFSTGIVVNFGKK
jgi:hypothetical protein